MKWMRIYCTNLISNNFSICALETRSRCSKGRKFRICSYQIPIVLLQNYCFQSLSPQIHISKRKCLQFPKFTGDSYSFKIFNKKFSLSLKTASILWRAFISQFAQNIYTKGSQQFRKIPNSGIYTECEKLTKFIYSGVRGIFEIFEIVPRFPWCCEYFTINFNIARI